MDFGSPPPVARQFAGDQRLIGAKFGARGLLSEGMGSEGLTMWPDVRLPQPLAASNRGMSMSIRLRILPDPYASLQLLR